MNDLRPRRPSPALVISVIALVMATAGTATAARALITKPSEIRTGVVNTGHVKNRSLLPTDFSAKARVALRGAQGPVGATGEKGDKGDACLPSDPACRGPQGESGQPGPGARWALVAKDGTIVEQSGGISVAAAPGNGGYALDFGQSTAGKAIQVTSASRDDGAFRGTPIAGRCGGTGTNSCNPQEFNNDRIVFVFTTNPANTGLEPHSFYIAVF